MTMLDISERASQSRELRSFTLSDIDVREAGDGGVKFDGVASVVETPYEVRDIFGTYQETIQRGAFTKTLKEKADVRLLVNHDGVPLARTKSGTLKLTAQPDLRAQAELDASNPRVQEIRSAMTRRDLDQMSIGFRVTRQEWNGDYTERSIREVELFDVSVVTYPASPTTTASLRSLDELVSLFPEGGEYDPDEVKRAIAHLERLIRSEEPAPAISHEARRLRLELEHKLAEFDAVLASH